MKTEKQIRALFTLAGIEVLRVWELPNNYWPESYADLRKENPWWLVKTPFGLIELGPRKRVFSIHWEETNIRKIITNDTTTKSETMVHAWTLQDALKYLRLLAAEVSP